MYSKLTPRAKRDLVHVVIDTPKGSRNKYKWDQALNCFRLSRILPAGAAFPYNFGSVPGTIAEDGDALDVLVVMDDPVPVGVVLETKLIGVIVAEQRESNAHQATQNDRLIAVPVTQVNPARANTISDLHPALLDEIEHFFVSYNRAQGREFIIKGRAGADKANALLDAGIHASVDAQSEKDEW